MRISQGRLCHYPTILDIDTASDQLWRTNRRRDVRDISCDARIAERRRGQEHGRGHISDSRVSHSLAESTKLLFSFFFFLHEFSLKEQRMAHQVELLYDMAVAL
jgi:hypothetical protein